MRNPMGSVKDRLAVHWLRTLSSGACWEPERRSSLLGGNTGIGPAFVAAVRGYQIVLTRPESMSRERVALLEQLGA
jgi:cysteine synthase A